MVLCLAQHAGYGCRHSGACCTSNWPIHIETDRVDEVRRAIADGRLARPAAVPLVAADDLPPGAGAMLGRTASGACAFHDAAARRCTIHRDLGNDALPAACQHFPRRCVVERESTSVTLSHYCPTVARMAFDHGPARGIVEAPGSLVGHVRLEGLDARDALPPLLRPGICTDVDGYHAWERAVVGMLEAGAAPEAALARIRAMTERVRSWSPGGISLAGAVSRAANEAGVTPAPGEAARPDERTLRSAFEIATAAVPDGFRPPPLPSGIHAADSCLVAPGWGRFSRPLSRFLAAHAFGSWYAYLGTGLMTVVRSLDLSLAVVRVEAARICEERDEALNQSILAEAFRAADLLLVHLADPKALARAR